MFKSLLRLGLIQIALLAAGWLYAAALVCDMCDLWHVSTLISGIILNGWAAVGIAYLIFGPLGICAND